MRFSLNSALSSIAALGVGAAAYADTPAFNVSDPSTLLGARSTARAGATVASATVHDSLLQNPAGSAFQKAYAVTVGYLGVGDVFTASVVDTKSSEIGGGLYYMKRDFRTMPLMSSLGLYQRMEERMGFSLFGKPGEAFGIGTNVKYVYRRSYDSGRQIGNGKNWNADIGARYILNPSVTLGVLGQNLMTDELGVNPKMLQAGIEASLAPGLLIAGQVQKLAIPGLNVKIGWGLSAEYTVQSEWSLRAGYTDNGAWQEKTWGAGLGYLVKTFAIDYSIEGTSGGGASSSPLHSLSLTGYL